FHRRAGFTFEDVIDLRQPFVKMGRRVDRDVHAVQARLSAGDIEEGPPRPAARAGDGRDLGQIGDGVAGRIHGGHRTPHGWGGSSVSFSATASGGCSSGSFGPAIIDATTATVRIPATTPSDIRIIACRPTPICSR